MKFFFLCRLRPSPSSALASCRRRTPSAASLVSCYTGFSAPASPGQVTTPRYHETTPSSTSSSSWPQQHSPAQLPSVWPLPTSHLTEREREREHPPHPYPIPSTATPWTSPAQVLTSCTTMTSSFFTRLFLCALLCFAQLPWPILSTRIYTCIYTLYRHTHTYTQVSWPAPGASLSSLACYIAGSSEFILMLFWWILALCSYIIYKCIRVCILWHGELRYRSPLSSSPSQLFYSFLLSLFPCCMAKKSIRMNREYIYSYVYVAYVYVCVCLKYI